MARVAMVLLECSWCGRRHEPEHERLPQPPTRCQVPGCGGRLLASPIASAYRLDPAEIDFDEDRPKRGRPRQARATDNDGAERP